MVKGTDYVVHNLFNVDVGVFPGVYDAGCDVLKDGGSHISRWWIEYIGEVVFRKHRMRGVGTIWIFPWLVLMLSMRVSANCLNVMEEE